MSSTAKNEDPEADIETRKDKNKTRRHSSLFQVNRPGTRKDRGKTELWTALKQACRPPARKVKNKTAKTKDETKLFRLTIR